MELANQDKTNEIELLTAEANRALTELRAAQNVLDRADDPALVEYAIYGMEAAQCKYAYMLRKLKEFYRQEEEQTPG